MTTIPWEPNARAMRQIQRDGPAVGVPYRAFPIAGSPALCEAAVTTLFYSPDEGPKLKAELEKTLRIVKAAYGKGEYLLMCLRIIQKWLSLLEKQVDEFAAQLHTHRIALACVCCTIST